MSELQEAQFKKVIDRLLDDNKALRDLVDWQSAENQRLRKDNNKLRELMWNIVYETKCALEEESDK